MKRLHVPALDGFRALMVFMVGWYHIWQQSWLAPRLTLGGFSLNFEPYVRTGYMLVDGMILLSGFVLFLPYAQCRRERTPLPRVLPFYQRRLSRVLPSYLFMIAVMFFGIALPQEKYASAAAMWKDIGAHFTFTFMFSPATYLNTPLNMAAWTLCVEMQFYLLFPLLARAMVKRPAITALAMVEAGFLYRLYCCQMLTSYNMVVNQMPAFLDVFALGMVAAMIYVRLHDRLGKWLQGGMLFLSLAGAYGVMTIMQRQSWVSGFENIQRWQMIRRFPLALCLMCAMLGFCLSWQWLQKAMGCKPLRFLASISMNFYLWHQVLSVQLKHWHIPPYEAAAPQMAGEQPWQTLYTYLCFILAAAWAALLTYGIEKPGARCLRRLFSPKHKEEPHV